MSCYCFGETVLLVQKKIWKKQAQMVSILALLALQRTSSTKGSFPSYYLTYTFFLLLHCLDHEDHWIIIGFARERLRFPSSSSSLPGHTFKTISSIAVVSCSYWCTDDVSIVIIDCHDAHATWLEGVSIGILIHAWLCALLLHSLQRREAC